jgi:hypothetical protein
VSIIVDPLRPESIWVTAGKPIMMKKITIFLFLLFAGIIFAAGCTGPASPVVPTQKTPVPTNPSAVVPVTLSVTHEPLPNVTSLPFNLPGDTITTVPTTRIASDNPYLGYLNVRKRTFDDPLPNCLMGNAFPFIKNETSYGIQQIVPKLSAISEDEYWSFLRRYTQGNAENTPLKIITACQGSVTAEPTWNFVEIRVVLDPTNYNRANYTITENVWSDGKIVAQFPITRQLVIDEQVILTSYIPVRTNEVDLIDSVVVTYSRL